MTTNAISLAEIDSTPVQRLRSGINEIDWCYGSALQDDGRRCWGLPVGGVSLWAGAAGSGKSRIAIAVAAHLSQASHTVLYFQNEVNLAQFKGWVEGAGASESSFFVSDATDPMDQLRLIQQIRPCLIVIDSVSMIQGIERQGIARKVILGLKAAAEEAGAHVLLLAHLNSRGKIKGGSTMEHLSDVVVKIAPDKMPPCIAFSISAKNRYGSADKAILLTHTAESIAPIGICLAIDPMAELRIDPISGKETRIVTTYGAGGRMREVDEFNQPLEPERQRGFIQRFLGLRA